MAKKHRRSALESMLHAATMPVTKIEVAPYDSRSGLAKFTAAEEAREQSESQRAEELATAPLRAIEAARVESMRVLREEHARYVFTAPSAELAARCAQIPENLEVQSVEQFRSQIRDSFNTWRLSAENDGLTLSQSGLEKLRRAAAANTSVDFRDPQSFCELYVLLENLGCFTDSDRTIQRPEPQPQERAQTERSRRTLADLESVNTDTRAGRAEASQILMEDMQLEVRTWYNAFADSLVRNFDHYLTNQETKAICNQMTLMNRSWTNAKNWDLSRIELVKKGLLPQNLRYRNEILDDLIESGDTRSYTGRRELQRQERLLGTPTTQVEY